MEVAARIRRSRAERARAWLYTGPLGHLYSVCLDIAVLWARWALSRIGR